MRDHLKTMVTWARLRKYTTIAIGTCAGAAVYYHQNYQHSVQNSWNNGDQKNPIIPSAIWNSDWDYCDPKSIVKPMKNNITQEETRYRSELQTSFPKVVRHIILVRHGEYLDVGETDETHKLTERGRLQAKYTGKRLHELGIEWDKIIASTQTRAQETAEIILNEINCDPKQMKHCNFIREGLPIPPQPPFVQRRVEKSVYFRDGARIEAGFRRYFHRAHPDEKSDSYTLIVAHVNVIRYFVCRALQFPPEGFLRMTLNHASITWLTIYPTGNVTIKYLGDSGFIPARYLTDEIPKGVKSVV